mgnify:CR=1 FL=1
MYAFPIGVIVDSFRLPLAQALAKAKSIGASGIQVYTTEGDMAPENLTPAKRRELLRLKRYYEQLDSIFDELTANDNGLLSHASVRRMAILGGRMDRYLNAVRNLQESVTQLREAYQSQLSIQQNELMKLFTVVTVIFLPLSLLAGWYGMNFYNMPELHWQYGYICVIIISIVVIIAECIYFKKKKML